MIIFTNDKTKGLEHHPLKNAGIARCAGEHFSPTLLEKMRLLHQKVCNFCIESIKILNAQDILMVFQKILKKGEKMQSDLN